VDRFIVLPFTREFAALPPEAFVEQILVDKVGLQEIVIGYDHGFGRGRRGDSALLETLGDRFGFSVDVIPAQVLEAHVVSSTEIRRLLMSEGDVARAAEMLGRSYELSGTVIHGDARGKTIGFPTANIQVQHVSKAIPLRGVYAVRAQVDDEAEMLGGMMNIGIRPTFEGTERRLEVHLFNTDRDLYDRQLRIEFVERIRDERKFDGIEALKQQLSEDRSRCKRALETLS
ncbi:MAG TPA: riboflavin biosynthesis protein RibF, partial [Rhodothermales bacterium]|nr:riboflavin biosynthesis protein RibF [Rhodothermales bacterium]